MLNLLLRSTDMNTNLPLPRDAQIQSGVIESNLIPEYDHAVVTSLYIYGRLWTMHATAPDNKEQLRIMMYMHQQVLLNKFWRFVGAI